MQRGIPARSYHATDVSRQPHILWHSVSQPHHQGFVPTRAKGVEDGEYVNQANSSPTHHSSQTGKRMRRAGSGLECHRRYRCGTIRRGDAALLLRSACACNCCGRTIMTGSFVACSTRSATLPNAHRGIHCVRVWPSRSGRSHRTEWRLPYPRPLGHLQDARCNIRVDANRPGDRQRWVLGL